MKTNIMRSVAAALGLTVCSAAYAQNGTYQAPAKWSQYRSGTAQPVSPFQTASTGRMMVVSAGDGQSLIDDLPAPTAPGLATEHVPAPQPALPTYQPQPVQTEIYQSPMHQGNVVAPQPSAPAAPAQMMTAPMETHAAQYVTAAPATPCTSCGPTTTFIEAASAPWEASCSTPTCAPVTTQSSIAPWFAGFNLLFFQFEDNDDRHLVIRDADAMPFLQVGQIAPESTLGFDASIGRYFGCGLYGLGATYMLFDPSEEMVTITAPTAGDYRAAMPAFQGLDLDPGTGNDTVYNHYDGASQFRARRDVFIQGIEANLYSFGIMGSRRVGVCGPAGGMLRNRACRPGLLRGYGGVGYAGYGTNGYGSGACGTNSCGPCADPCATACAPAMRPGRAFGGAGGPLARACNGRVQVVTSHGFRWFQFKDEYELAGDIDGTAGYQANDIYYNIETENNLFGYQFGSRLHYCLGSCLLFSVGGKAGIYGNSARFMSRVGTQGTLANITGLPAQTIFTDESDTTLSGLFECDLGIGYRFSRCLTARGGYRLLGASGVVSSTGSLATEYASVESAGKLTANDSFLLHGAYVGLDYNW